MQLFRNWSPARAAFSVLVPIWCIFTTKLELILRKMAKAQPQRLRAHAPARPTRKTLCLFFISPAEFLLQLKRVFSGGAASEVS
jgi:hypothetical protein